MRPAWLRLPRRGPGLAARPTSPASVLRQFSGHVWLRGGGPLQPLFFTVTENLTASVLQSALSV